MVLTKADMVPDDKLVEDLRQDTKYCKLGVIAVANLNANEED